jgi:hypothetical protein
MPPELDDLASLDDVLSPRGLGHVVHAGAAKESVIHVKKRDDGGIDRCLGRGGWHPNSLGKSLADDGPPPPRRVGP